MASIINATTTNGVAITPDNSGELRLQTNNGTTAVTIDTSQNVGVGTSSPTARLGIPTPLYTSSATGGMIRFQNPDVAADSCIQSFYVTGAGSNIWIGSNNYIDTNGSAVRFSGSYASSAINLSRDGTLAFYTSTGAATERMRITSAGDVLFGTTSTSLETGVGFKFQGSTTIPLMGNVMNTPNNNTTYHLYNTNATNNGYRFYVAANGGIYNYSGNNTNISDERTKENIELAGNYLDKICAIPVKTFNYKDEPTGEQKTLGVIAQDVETIAPEFVNNDGWKGTEPEDGVPLKTIYTTDMMFGLMKAIQELKAELDTVKAELASTNLSLADAKAELNTLKNPPVEGTE